MNSGLQPELLRHGLPLRRELAGLDHQHAVAGRQRIDQRRFPRAGAGRGVDDDRIGGLENGLDAVEAALGELGEFRAAMIDDRRVHRPQHAVGQRRRPRNLQEMTPGGARSILRHFRHSFGRIRLPRRRMSESAARLVALNSECDIRVKSNSTSTAIRALLSRSDLPRRGGQGAGTADARARKNARTAAQGGASGRCALRRLHAWALCHRRLALSDHAARRGDAAHDRGSRTGDRDLPGRRRAGDAARRRHVAGRPDRQPRRW